MRKTLSLMAVLAGLSVLPALAGEAEIKGAQSAITGQIEAFKAGENDKAYGYAAPTIKRIFPTLESFMRMVTGAYSPVYKPQSFSFGKVEEQGEGSVIQQVLIVGPDGKDYEAIYTLKRQEDGSYLITGVSMHASNALSA